MAVATSYSLAIGGRAAPPELLAAVRQIEVEDHAQMADMLRIELAVAVREDGGGWTVLDDGPFTRLAKLRITVTVGSGAAMPLIEAYVIDVDTSFSSHPGTSELSVTAMDPTVLMHLDEKVKSWPNMKDSDVASAIFSDQAYGFSPVVESTNLVAPRGRPHAPSARHRHPVPPAACRSERLRVLRRPSTTTASSRATSTRRSLKGSRRAR